MSKMPKKGRTAQGSKVPKMHDGHPKKRSELIKTHRVKKGKRGY